MHRTPRPVFELEDLCGQEIGQFYTEELIPVRITKQTTYKKVKYWTRGSDAAFLSTWFYGKDIAQTLIHGFLPAISSL